MSGLTKVPVLVLTVPRVNDYLASTLASLRASGYWATRGQVPTRIVTGCPGRGHIVLSEDIAQETSICEMPQEIARESRLQDLTPKQRCCLGHWYWMKLVLEWDRRPEYVLACEDDIVFARGWERYLQGVLGEIRRQLNKPAIVTLYRMYLKGHTNDRAKERFGKGARWYAFSDHFWGTQAVLYPTSILAGLSEHLYRNGVQSFKAPVDNLIGQFAWRRGIPTLATTPSLVNHLGQETTGQSDTFHEADFFLESLEGVM